MTLQETILNNDLLSIEQSVNVQFLDNWETSIQNYLADLQIGLDSLNLAPQSDEEWKEVFELKR